MKVVSSGNQGSQYVPRQGESQPPPKRSKRYYTIDSEWYFNTREDDAQGPFKNLGEAKDGLKTYLRRCGIVHFGG